MHLRNSFLLFFQTQFVSESLAAMSYPLDMLYTLAKALSELNLAPMEAIISSEIGFEKKSKNELCSYIKYDLYFLS